MSHPQSGTRNAFTEQDTKGTTVPEGPKPSDGKRSRTANAFTMLMSKKPKPAPKEPKPAKPKTYFAGSDGLGAYLANPAAFGPERVLYHNDKFVVINDLYPKSTVHTLVLPRDESKNLIHPFFAYEDSTLLADVKSEVEKVKQLVASELRRRFAQHSASEQARIQAMEADDIPDELPAGRDWTKDVMAGVHAHPSMNHLHVHVMSKDMMSNCMNHRKHYMSFNTDFFIPLDDFPLAADDYRRHPNAFDILKESMHCWRCGEEFGNQFKKLKAHLDDEFEEWKRV